PATARRASIRAIRCSGTFATCWPSTSTSRSISTSPARPWASSRSAAGMPVRPSEMSRSAGDSVRRLPVMAEKLEELHALAQASLHHPRVPHHFAHHGGAFRSSEIEASVEGFDRVIDFAVAEVRVMQGGDLDARGVDQVRIVGVEPAVLHGLSVEGGAGIGSGDRNLNRMRIDLGREADRLLDGLAALAR